MLNTHVPEDESKYLKIFKRTEIITKIVSKEEKNPEKGGIYTCFLWASLLYMAKILGSIFFNSFTSLKMSIIKISRFTICEIPYNQLKTTNKSINMIRSTFLLSR